ncbi:hypothetical protein Pcinc_036860 [Petrolisthes cinctipes]|uniref:Uncharacterized protein n=1 Tax=Petrolisthes cinctipes TaxID=88211 RepID=A0AAE1ELK4_PETCI|nr:hypothetical protein Pcinc_036860 [Petrolisthes cinctipes]
MSRRGSDNGDATKSHSEGGGPTINGSIDGMLTPELLFRMNKKIAQLTKMLSHHACCRCNDTWHQSKDLMTHDIRVMMSYANQTTTL